MKKYSPLLTINVTLLTLWFAVYVLYIGSSIIIPFVVAVLLSFMILSISNFYHKKSNAKLKNDIHNYLKALNSIEM